MQCFLDYQAGPGDIEDADERTIVPEEGCAGGPHAARQRRRDLRAAQLLDPQQLSRWERWRESLGSSPKLAASITTILLVKRVLMGLLSSGASQNTLFEPVSVLH